MSFSRPPQMYRYKRLFAVAAFLIVLLAVFEFSGLRANFNLVYLHQKFQDNELTGLLIFVALFALGNLIQIPGLVFLAAAVLALGEVWGGVATYMAAVVSCVFTFWVIRLLGGNALREIEGKWPRRLLAGLDAHPVKSVALLRVLLQTVPALNYALALSGVKFRNYLIGTLIGLPLPIAFYCIFFDYIARSLHIPGY
ncbi:MAG: VTT domain-containing protein [Pseudomonadota bacterium]